MSTLHKYPKASSAITLASGLMMAALPVFAQGPAIPLPGLGTGSVDSSAVSVMEESPESSDASRYVDAEGRAEYLQKKLAIFSMTSRPNDPFGQVQDPTAKVAVIKPTITSRRPTSLKKTTFDDIVGRIKINTIMPSENRFLVGTRSFKLGDEFPISYRGRKTMVEVIGVKSNKIDFKNKDTGEISSVKLSLMPAGMSSGSDGFNAPGMVEDKADAPLQLEPASGF